MIEINLIPDVKQELIQAERVRSLVISSSVVIGLVAAGVVVLLSAYVFGVQSVRSTIADDSIKKGSAQLASVEDLSKVLTIQNQITNINALNDHKKIDSRIFDVLAAIIPEAPNDVKVSNVSIDAANSKITIDGQAGQGYSALEVFKKTISGGVVKFNEDDSEQEVVLATEISTSDVSYGEDSTGAKVLRFTVSFVYPEQLFAPSSKELKIAITNQGNVTDSFLGLPKSIFTERAKDLEGTE
jgi:Tfp pilus assembly protein PilN